MKLLTGLLLIATVFLASASCAHVQPRSTTHEASPQSEPEAKPKFKPETTAESVRNSDSQNRTISADEAAELALATIHGNAKLIKHFIDPADKNQHLFLEPCFNPESPLPPQSEPYEFEVYGEYGGSEHASLYAYVSVNPRNGQVLLRGTVICDEDYMTIDRFLVCYDARSGDPEK